jgi:hypothetical protein
MRILLSKRKTRVEAEKVAYFIVRLKQETARNFGIVPVWLKV